MKTVVNHYMKFAILFILTLFLSLSQANAMKSEIFLSPNLISDGEYVYGRNMKDFDLDNYLIENAPHLLPYRQDIFSVSISFSINPRILLTLMEMKSGIVANPQAPMEQLENPFDIDVGGMANQLYVISELLDNAFYYHFYEITPLAEKDRPDMELYRQSGQRISLTPSTNAGSFAISSVISEFFSDESLGILTDNSNENGFYQTYLSLFPDANPLDSSITLPRPDDLIPDDLPYLQFPFPVGEAWKFNGTHGSEGTNIPYNSIDFSRYFDPPGADTSGDWVVAAAQGNPQLAGPTGKEGCQIYIHHDGNGTRTVYYHLENWKESLPDVVPANYQLANPANTRDEALCHSNARWDNRIHGHFSLYYEGVAWPLDGVSMSEWTIQSGPTAYSCLTRLVKDGEDPKEPWCDSDNVGDAVLNEPNYASTLTIELGSILKNRLVTLHILRSSAGGTLPPIETHFLETDSQGNVPFIILHGISPDTYDLYVKPEGWLTVKLTGVFLNEGHNHANFNFSGQGGDINEDNKVNGLDYARMFEDWDPLDRSMHLNARRSDLNGDGNVNGLDYVILFQGWGNEGAHVPTGPENSPEDGNTTLGQSGTLSLEITGNIENYNVPTVAVGDIIDLNLNFDTNGLSMAGADVLLDYDPCVVQPLTDNIVESGIFTTTFTTNFQGVLNYNALKFDYFDPNPGPGATGSGNLAVIPFEVLRSTPGLSNISIRFVQSTTPESNMMLDNVWDDFLGEVGSFSFHPTGQENRPSIEAEIIAPINGESFNEEIIRLTAEANDPCDGIRKVTFYALLDTPPEIGHVTTPAGSPNENGSSNGYGPDARFNFPFGITIDDSASIAYIADTLNHTIRHLDINTNEVTTIAGLSGVPGSDDGVGSQARFDMPYMLSLSPNGELLLISDHDNHTIRQIDATTGYVTTLAGQANSQGSQDGIGANARFRFPAGIDVSMDNAFALVADKSNHTIRRINLSTAEVTTIAGLAGVSGSQDGVGSNARFSFPEGVGIFPDGSKALIADTGNKTIRLLDLQTGEVTTIAGLAGVSGSQDGFGSNARFNNPQGVDLAKDSKYALIADTYNHTLRVIFIETGQVITVAGSPDNIGNDNGSGDNASFGWPSSAALSSDYGVALVSDAFSSVIREISFWNEIGTDPDGSDSWSVALETSALSDRQLKIKAFVGDFAGNGIETEIENISIDREIPSLTSVNFDPPTAFQGQPVSLSVIASDDLAGVELIAAYVDPSTDGSAPWHYWRYLGTIEGNSGEFYWDTNSFGAGHHDILLEIVDAAGNRNYVTSLDDPGLNYLLLPGWSNYLPIINRP